MLGGVIRGRNTTLRVPTEADLPAFNAWMADPAVRRGGPVWHEPAMLATWRERLAETARDRRNLLWSIDEGTRVVGLCRVRLGWQNNDVVRILGLVIDPAAQGRGLGGDAALAVHRFLFDYHPTRAAEVSLPADSIAALGIAERLGYTVYARGTAVYYRNGAYADEISLRFDRATWDARWAATEREYPPGNPADAL